MINIKINKNKKLTTEVKSILKLMWKDIGENLHKKYFSVRSGLNTDLWKITEANGEFNEDVRKIQKELSIPKLKFDDDFELISLPNEIDVRSKWLEFQPVEIKDKFKLKIQDLVLKYHLPFYSADFLKEHILWKIPFSEAPKGWLTYSSEFPTNELERLPPVSQEKRMLKNELRNVYKIKRRPNTKNEHHYREFLDTLDKFKNKTRRFRSLDMALKAYKKPLRKKYIDYAGSGENENPKYTYGELATDMFQTEKKDNLDKQINKLKKQKQRLKKRLIN